MKKRFIIFYVAAFCIVAGLSFATPAFSTILFYEDFEDELDFVNEWKRSGKAGSQELTTEQIRAGSSAYKFSLTRYDSGDYREEINLLAPFNPSGSDRSRFKIGNEYWTGFSIFLANGYHNPVGTGCDWMIHHQYHGDRDESPTCVPDELSRNPVVVLQTNQGNWHNGCRWDSHQCTIDKNYDGNNWEDYGPFVTGQWIDFVVNVKFSFEANGFLKIWKNGVLVTDHTGGTCYNDVVGPFLAIGIYSYCLEQEQTVTIYYDELRIGDNNSSYSEVAPGGSVKPLPPTSVRIIDK